MPATVDSRRVTDQGEALPAIVFIWVNSFLRMTMTMSLVVGSRSDGAYHQVYLLSGGSLTGIMRLKRHPSPPGSTHTHELSPAVGHRKRTVV